MLARKKYVMQKSFRIDQRLEYDTALLAELTARSQNDLVNVAIQEFLKDNGKWFLENAIVEQFSPIFEFTGEDYNPIFEMGGVRVELKDESGVYKVHCTIKNNGQIVEDYEKHISIAEDDAEDSLKHQLRYIASYINEESEDSKAYLKKRLDYSDYVPVKK